METLIFSVHEFMIMMGILREQKNEGKDIPKDSIWNTWQPRYQELDRDLEKLDMMRRADMLFDGKVTFHDVSNDMIREVMSLVDIHLKFEQNLIEEGDLDGDPDEVEIWRMLRLRLETSLEQAG
ncbi:hypothetical protein N9L49_02545 [Rhodospirillales bacterium]|nr:hypothetical protein [Rhodospirillales bacterium]